MGLTNWHKKLLTFAMVLVGLILLFAFEGSSATLAQDDAAHIRQVRALDTNDLGLLNPAGLAYSPDANVFFVLEAHSTTQANIVTMTPFEDLVGSVSVNVSMMDPINMVFDSRANRLLLFDTASDELVEIKAGPDGYLDPSLAAISRFQVGQLGLRDPRGMTIDAASGHLLILDSSARQIVRIEPDSQGGFDGAAALVEGRVSRVDLKQAGLVDPQGLAFNPSNGHLYLLSPVEQKLYELTETGRVVATLDLSPFEFVDPQGLVFASSGDLTDDPSIINLYIADSGLGVGQSQAAYSPESGQTDPVSTSLSGYQIYLPLVMGGSGDGGKNRDQQKPGKIVELSFAEPVQLIRVAAADFISTLVQTTDTSQWSPPSPDTAGITYLSDEDRLLVSDSEVNEMPIYDGVNLFKTTLSGGVLDTSNTLAFSNEPTGTAFQSDPDPDKERLFISDDDKKEIFVLKSGTDGLFGTADDVLDSQFDTLVFGSGDPEGIAFDGSGPGVLYIADGVNNEVYKVTPGPNGVFDGVDDVVTNFDTLSLGVEDPEGITFDTNNGHLYIVGKPQTNIAEITTDGILVLNIDISAANAKKPAGLAFAPGSVNPGVMNIYIVARGVDNDSNPNENDGKMYEMTLPPSGPAPPVANDDSASTTVNTPVIINTAANDIDFNGNLDPNSANSSCGYGSTGCDGAANGSLTDNGDGTITYTPDSTFIGLDSFVYEICDTDSLCDTATVTVSVGLLSIDVGVAASTDDAEEKATGGMRLTSSDLELVYDGSNQTVGIRFNGVDIPPGATIASAYVQFQVDETNSVATSLTIQGEDIDNAPTFTSSTGNISSRVKTTASLSWSPVPWTIVGDSGTDQRTPDMASVIQEIVNRPGWSIGNSLVVIITGTGERTAEAYDGVQAAAPLLHVEYNTGPPNDPPVANDDSASTAEDTAVMIDVVANDSDPEGSLEPASANTDCPTCTLPSNGGLVNNRDGSFEYAPNPDFNGSDSFVYEICDTLGACDTAAVSITVTPVADPPVVNDDVASTSEDTSVTIDVAANDSDPDGNLDPASANTTCAGCSVPANGLLGNNGNGTFDYTPNPGFTGPDSFVYEVCDTDSTCDTATVSITVTPTNDPPVANDDSGNTAEDSVVMIDVAANDSDPDGNLDPTSANTTCSTCNQPGNGSLVNNGDGTFTYSPNPDFNGSDSFVYEICDTINACDTATVTITVTSVPDPPLASEDSVSTLEDTGVTIDAAANDTDPDGDLDPTSANTICTGCADPANGTLINNGDGSFTYNPNPGFTGNDSFVYEICDTGSLCDTATVSITVNPSAPIIVEVRVSASSDDAEERSLGSMKLTSSDLELTFDAGGDQTVGMRFNGVDIPPGATIVSAYVRFQVDETNSAATYLTIQGEAIDNAATFTSSKWNIVSRTRTTAAVLWSPMAWTTVGEAGPDQRTPNMNSVIQEIVNRPGWSSDNSLVVIITGTGERTAESFDGGSTGAPLLHVEYRTGGGPPLNQPPTVDAGPDQTITLPASANLDGMVSDDGLPDPPGAVATTWSQVSGPGIASFGDASAVDTTASFPEAGTYVLRLIAEDGDQTASEEVTIVVIGIGGETVTEVRVSASSDDAEERSSGSMKLTSSDLELTFDGGSDQTVGMRFNGVDIPPGATIVSAYVQFQVDEMNSVATSLTIQGEAIDNAATFTSSKWNISSRARTTAYVPWSPVPWTTVGEAGLDQQTPDIASVIQEIVKRSNWSSGNSLVVIITGTGERTAESFDGVPAAAPLLYVEYIQ